MKSSLYVFHIPFSESIWSGEVNAVVAAILYGLASPANCRVSFKAGRVIPAPVSRSWTKKN